MLIEQTYPGREDDINHFNKLLKAFLDDRYLKIDGKPIFVIYSPLHLPHCDEFIQCWNKLARDNGLKGIYFIGYSYNADKEYKKILDLGFDAVNSCRLNRNRIKGFGWFIRKVFSVIFNTPRKTNYAKFYHKFIGDLERQNQFVYPTLIPNWDHTPRSGVNGDLLTKSTPQNFKKHCIDVINSIKSKEKINQICFLKSWNEWGEGNYMEPDIIYGHGYINALNQALSESELVK